MLERLLHLKIFCIEHSESLKVLKISESQWSKIEEICEALRPIAQLTTELEHEKLDITQFVAFWKHVQAGSDRF